MISTSTIFGSSIIRSLLCRGTLAAALFLSISGQAHTAVIDARSPSLVDVNTALNLAKDGDTVNVPAGTATWTSSLQITSNITFRGAGQTSTIIANGITGGNSRPPLLWVSLARNLPFRMTGFTFKGGSATAETFNGEIRVTGNSHAFRIDHCTFDQLHGTELAVNGFLWGVVDHCQFNIAEGHPITVNHDTWNGGTKGANSWADDPYWGSERFLFIEDNVFEKATGKTGIDAFEGSRFVVRHNQFHNCGLTGHGTEAQGRGTKQIEEYNNSYRNDILTSAGQLRSGAIVTHDNTWANVDGGHVLQSYRQFERSVHWNIANGQTAYDDNATNGTTGFWESGKHTGPNGSTILIDSTKHWATNQWYVAGATFIVRNVTQEAATANHTLQTFAISNTATAITCSSLTFTGAHLAFNTGDTYQIWKINHSLDQPGLGKGDLLVGLPGLPCKWPNQVTEPCYSWNNKLVTGANLRLSSSEPSIKEGRDFFNDTPKPGYQPYTYPHPLIGLAPPSNLQVAGQ